MTWPVEPVEVPPSRWAFPNGPAEIEAGIRLGEIATVGGDLEPGTLLAAYRAGLFPMPLTAGPFRRVRAIGWFSPDPRGILPLDGLRVSRSLRRSVRRYEVRVDTAFEDVIEACADRKRPGAWIDVGIRRAYTHLHELGWAHSVEAWDEQGLAGGLYGVAIGGLFAGESMFHRRTDASKVALVRLVERLRADGTRLLDVQWATDHLRSLGAIEVPRERYHELLSDALGAYPRHAVR
ncbi:MAG: leucyl/phenylalanyl-tRNA--protein transferase [Acidimicrobiaceae bacterium]|nr:leucyl/phenylalanyl-tRNA--protein transferase [Acidimicrobiaceae bacterium]